MLCSGRSWALHPHPGALRAGHIDTIAVASTGSMGGTATVVIGLEPGLVARDLQQDPARGVVVQIARATTAKAPAAGKW